MKNEDKRLPALKRFAAAITALNLFGHFFLGFEQSIAHMLIALGTAYSLELVFETIIAKVDNREALYKGGFLRLLYFLLPSHISALAVSMLLFTNAGLIPVVFGTAVAILSKIIFRVKVNGRARHFLNPSNTGIAVCFLLFPWIGTAPPYQFSENVSGWGDWMLVLIFVCLGSFLNTKFTRKMPLIFAWLIGFFLQAVIRTNIFGTATIAALMPMTGIAFLLFTFYMISDPSTTPMKMKNQIWFGSSVAAVYGVFMSLHIVFGLFFALFTVCTVRGVYFWIIELVTKDKVEDQVMPVKKEILDPISV